MMDHMIERKNLALSGLEHPTHIIRHFHTLFTIFKMCLPRSLMRDIFNSHIEENENAFHLDLGTGKIWSITPTNKLLLTFLAQ